MPHQIEPNNLTLKHIAIKELHPTFGAEVTGVDFAVAIPDDVLNEILSVVAKYGVVVFRKTGLDDARHVEFARRFGELDDVTPYNVLGRKNRLQYDELFDGNSLFHVDSSFNPRRAGYSLLLAHELPPPGMGGQTAFADTRTAFEDLNDELKTDLLANDYIACHSLYHSRQMASPEYFADLKPLDHMMSRHRLIQLHEPSRRMNLYIASHAHHIEGIEAERSAALLNKLYEHAKQEKYIFEAEWRDPGDLVMWDNTCVMHRAVGGNFEGKYRRDMRRATVHDGSSQAWGLNEHTNVRSGLP